MKSKTKIITLICCVLLMWIIGTVISNKEKSVSDDYFSRLNLVFSGVVYEKEYLDHGDGIIRINITLTNKPYYDVRDSLKYYYCTIKNGKAELIGQYNYTNVGDSIYVNSPLRIFKLYRKNNLIYEHPLYGLTQSQTFYDKFRSLQKL